jgi:hypothetical protein
MPDSPNMPDVRHADIQKGIPLPLPVALQRPEIAPTNEIALWAVIRQASQSISFDNYEKFIAKVCAKDLTNIRRLPFARIGVYELLKAATEEFLIRNCGVLNFGTDERAYWARLAADATLQLGRPITSGMMQDFWKEYVGNDGNIPYIDRLRNKFPESSNGIDEQLRACILEDRIKHPCMIELIWSYWNEEAMLVQVLNAISLRFQNRRGPGERYLANLELDTLRPINNLMWGYVQDEQHRLTIARRAGEYDHQYGFGLYGRAVGRAQPADSRSHFLEGFHQLLHLTARFYQQDDDTTVRADGFPVLNALKEVHMTLGEGGSNQYGDLPWVARLEMMMQQLILARPEMREFFSSRPGVIYPEPWMERIESAKTLLGLEGPNVLHMHYLATMGERLLLSIRYHPWSNTVDAGVAASWARDFRSDVQGYIHSYRAATGVDLSASAVTERIDATMPALLLRRRQELTRRR